MSTDNQSPSYRKEREAVRKWIEKTPDGQYARKQLMDAMGGDASSVLDDDQHVDWEEIVREYKGATVLAANCREAREAFELARQSSSLRLLPPSQDKSSWVRFLAAPMGYVLRRQLELADPEYWNDPLNVYREALEHPEWCAVPMDVIRGLLESVLPKARKGRGIVRPIVPGSLPHGVLTDDHRGK